MAVLGSILGLGPADVDLLGERRQDRRRQRSLRPRSAVRRRRFARLAKRVQVMTLLSKGSVQTVVRSRIADDISIEVFISADCPFLNQA